MSDIVESKLARLVEARNKVISEMNEVCPSWQPKRLRALQVAASKLASEIGKVKKAA